MCLSFCAKHVLRLGWFHANAEDTQTPLSHVRMRTKVSPVMALRLHWLATPSHNQCITKGYRAKIFLSRASSVLRLSAQNENFQCKVTSLEKYLCWNTFMPCIQETLAKRSHSVPTNISMAKEKNFFRFITLSLAACEKCCGALH